MRRVYVFVETPTAAEFLRRIVPPELLQDAEVFAGSGIPGLAGSVLAQRRKPIAVVMDADSLAPDVIRERRQTVEELICLGKSPIPVKVIAAVPTIESWLFAAPEAIARVFGEPVPSDYVTFGRRDPEGVLQELARKSNRPWDFRQAIGQLDAGDIDRIRALPEVSELLAFLEKVQKDDKAA
jgi:hypothetical protein